MCTGERQTHCTICVCICVCVKMEAFRYITLSWQRVFVCPCLCQDHLKDGGGVSLGLSPDGMTGAFSFYDAVAVFVQCVIKNCNTSETVTYTKHHHMMLCFLCHTHTSISLMYLLKVCALMQTRCTIIVTISSNCTT